MISNAKARAAFDFNPRPLTETIKDSLVWLKENGNIR